MKQSPVSSLLARRYLAALLAPALLLVGACSVPSNTVGARQPLEVQPPTSTPHSAAGGSVNLEGYTGQVLGLDGRPAAGVTVTGYSLVSNNGGSLISDKGGSIVSNNGSSYRVQSASGTASGTSAAGALTATTDAQGRFMLRSPDGTALNLEAVQSQDVKAIQFGVASEASGVVLQLAHTGVLTGKVVAPGSTASDLTGVSVFVPGTQYVAMTDASGSYTFAAMPVGSFTLDAAKTGLGRARETGVAVQSEKTTTAAPLTLAQSVPTISTITPAAGGPGTSVTITGTNFGASQGVPFTVSFGGSQASNPTRQDDHTIVVTVPDGATSGDVVVTSDQVPSKPASFYVPTSLTLGVAVPALFVGQSAQIGAMPKDAKGADSSALALTWTSNAPAIAVNANGTVTAKASGDATIAARSGKVAGNLVLHAYDGPSVVTWSGARTDFGDPNRVTYRDGPAAQAIYNNVAGILRLSDGSWMLTDAGNDCLRRVSPDGMVSVFAGAVGQAGAADGKGAAARFNGPQGIALAPDGSILVADQGNQTIRRVAPDGTTTTVAGVPGQSGFRNGPAASALFNQPTAIAVDAAGAIYVSEAGNQLIRKIANGMVSTYAGDDQALTPDPNASGAMLGAFKDGPAASARFHTPLGLALGPDGTLYVADSDNVRIRAISPSGVVSTLAGSPAAPENPPNAFNPDGFAYADGTASAAHFAYPTGVAVDAHGDVYVGDSSNWCIRKITPAGVVTTIAGVPCSSATDWQPNQNQIVDGPAAGAQMNFPSSLAFDPNGNLYFEDTGELRVLLLPPAK